MATTTNTSVGTSAASAQKIDHDLIHELSRRIDALSRYDEYIANAREREAVRHFWAKVRSQEEQNVQLLKELLAEEMRYVSI